MTKIKLIFNRTVGVRLLYLLALVIQAPNAIGQELRIPANILQATEYKMEVTRKKDDYDFSKIEFSLAEVGSSEKYPVEYRMKPTDGKFEFTFSIDRKQSRATRFIIISNDGEYKSNEFNITASIPITYTPASANGIFINEELKFAIANPATNPFINEKQLLFELDNQLIVPRVISSAGSFQFALFIPNDRTLIGTGRNLRLIYNSPEFQKNIVLNTGTVDIAGKEPHIITHTNPFLYSDVSEYQTLDFKVENFNSINTIKLLPATLLIKGASGNSISASSSYIKYDAPTKTLSIDFKNTGAMVSPTAIEISYNAHTATATPFLGLNIAPTTATYAFTVPLTRKFSVANQLTVSPGIVFDNDFSDLINIPTFTVDLKNTTTADRTFDLRLDPNVFNTSILIPATASSTTFKIYNTLQPGFYTVTLSPPGAAASFQGGFLVRAKPTITNFFLDFKGNANTQLSPYSPPQKKHYLIIEGISLDDQDISFYLTGNGNQIALTNVIHRSSSHVKVELFDPLGNQPQQLLVGDYRLAIERRRKNGTTTNDEFVGKTLTINPTQQLASPSQLVFKFLDGSNQRSDNDVVEGDSFYMDIDGSSIPIDYDQQALKVTLSLYDYHGKKVKEHVIMENGSEQMIISSRGRKITSVNVMRELLLSELQPYNRIAVQINRLSNNATPAPTVLNFYTKGTVKDRFGLVLSAPPFLVAAREVRGKVRDAEGNVTYSGSYKLSLQSLVVNAGFGVKYIPRCGPEDFYKPSQFNVGLYFIGLDLVNPQTKEEQQVDLDNRDFIGRGSFNMLLLGEFNMLNFSNMSVKVPLNLGIMTIFDPLDDGPRLAPVFGLGINLPIAGAQAK